MIRLRGCVLVTAFAAAAGAAHTASASASGHFTSGGVRVPVEDAFAFPGKLDFGRQSGILVAVTHASISPVIAKYQNRRYILDRWAKSNDIAILYLQFTKDGKYLGKSYEIEPGNECSACRGSEQSSVNLSRGRLQGTVIGKYANRVLGVTIDVPVTSDDLGLKQGTGGGAPGKAYLAFHAAVQKGDPAAIQKAIAQQSTQGRAAIEKLDPPKVAVTQGFVNRDDALLLISGENAKGQPVKGEVLLHKEAGAWKIVDLYASADLK
jgi:hypothetical protein